MKLIIQFTKGSYIKMQDIKEIEGATVTLPNHEYDGGFLKLTAGKNIVVDYRAIQTKIKELTEREAKLVAGIRKTINDNLHLADGENCTLIELKRTLQSLGLQE